MKRKMNKNVFAKLAVLLLTGCMLVSCGKYTAKDYIDDLKELTEETAKNASSYTQEDWKEVAAEFRKLNEKGAEACKELTDEQAKEIRKLKKELRSKAAGVDSEELKKELDDLSEQAGEALKDIFGK